MLHPKFERHDAPGEAGECGTPVHYEQTVKEPHLKLERPDTPGGRSRRRLRRVCAGKPVHYEQAVRKPHPKLERPDAPGQAGEREEGEELKAVAVAEKLDVAAQV
jgi:hypothetical protein